MTASRSLAVGVRAPGRRLTLAGPALIGLLAAAHAASDIPYAAVSALLPTIQARFGLSEVVLSLLVATFLFGASVTQPLFGALADRVGPRAVGAAGVVANSALLSLVGVAPMAWLVFGLLLAGGLASAALHPAFTGLVRRNARNHPSLAVSVFSAAGTFGVALGPVLVMVVMTAVGLEGTPLLMIPGLALGVAAWLALPDATDGRVHLPRLPLHHAGLLRLRRMRCSDPGRPPGYARW